MSAEIIKNITAAPTTADQNQPPQPPQPAQPDQPEIKLVETPPPIAEQPKEVSETELLTGGKTDNAAPAIPTLPNVEVLPPATDNTKRGPGRPPGAKNKGKAPKAADFSDIQPLVPPVNYDEMSKALFDMTTGVLSNTLGPEWQPQSPDERQNVCSCLSVYLKTKEVKDIPPGLMLTIVVVAYAGPRLAVPTTRDKIKPAVLWGWNKVKSFFARKPKLSIVPGPNQPPTP